MEREALGTVAAVVGVVLLAGTLVGSAAVAPSIGTTDDGTDRRPTLVGVQSESGRWHHDGNVHLLVDGDERWRAETAESYFDVTMLEDGTVMAGFMNGGLEDCGPYGAPCARTGFHIIDPDGGPDGGPAVVHEYSFPVRTRTNSEVHDVERLGPGEYLLTDMDAERIVVVEDGEEVWEWRASELYEAPPDPTRRDWLHINDVDVVAEDRYLVSVRNANQLVLVERGEGVVEVINADDGPDDNCLRDGQLFDADGDGDVKCGDPDVMDHQHNPQWLDEGAVLVADSGNDRIVELHKTADGDWEVAWTLEQAGGIGLSWPRDADRLPNNNTLVTDTGNSRIFEVTENGTVVWSTRSHTIPYEADRLPVGEPAEGARYGSVEGEVEPPNGGVPVLTPALGLLRGALPGLPFWFGELQLALTTMGLALAGGGAWVRRDA